MEKQHPHEAIQDVLNRILDRNHNKNDVDLTNVAKDIIGLERYVRDNAEKLPIGLEQFSMFQVPYFCTNCKKELTLNVPIRMEPKDRMKKVVCGTCGLSLKKHGKLRKWFGKFWI